MTAPFVDLESYDWIVVNSSGGKDSVVALDRIAMLTTDLGIKHRVVVFHADLGRVEWRETRELAERQATQYGFRFEVIARPQGDLLQHVEARGMWPSNKQRYCTSDHKRAQAYKLLTRLTAESARPVRILNVMGIRADESPARAKKQEFTFDQMASNGKRHVDTWFPIFDWSTEDVWDYIHGSDLEYHYAYDLGMPRLSCAFCIFSPKAALVLAGQHNRELLDEYCAVETRIGHTFRTDVSLVQIRDMVNAGANVDGDELQGSWCM